MKHFFKKNQGGDVSDCNLPFKEDGEAAVQLTVNEDQLDKVTDGTHDFDVVNDKVVLKESNRKAEKLAKKQAIEDKKTQVAELKAKLKAGQASNEEVQSILATLL